MERKKVIVTEHINENGIGVLEASDIIEVINFDGKASEEEIDNAIQEVIKSTRFIKSGKVLDFEEKLSEYLNTNVIA